MIVDSRAHICLTGFTRAQKELLKERIKALNGGVSDGIRKNTTALLVGRTPGPKKLVLARARGIPIITQHYLIDELGGGGLLNFA